MNFVLILKQLYWNCLMLQQTDDGKNKHDIVDRLKYYKTKIIDSIKYNLKLGLCQKILLYI